MTEKEISYFYLIYEGDKTELEEKVRRVFDRFRSVHQGVDSDVRYLMPKDSDFPKARDAYEVRKLPAFVVSDMVGFSNGDPYITVERDTLEKLATEDAIYGLISDLHYVVLDDKILRWKTGAALQKLGGVLRVLWEEIKDLVRVQTVPK